VADENAMPLGLLSETRSVSQVSIVSRRLHPGST